jgi:hypothetical protein
MHSGDGRWETPRKYLQNMLRLNKTDNADTESGSVLWNDQFTSRKNYVMAKFLGNLKRTSETGVW